MKRILFAVVMVSVLSAGSYALPEPVAAWLLDDSLALPDGAEWTPNTAPSGGGGDYALSLDGTQGVDTNLTAADIGIDGVGPKTVTGWINTTQSGAGYNGWIWGWSPTGGSGPGNDLRLCVQDGNLRFEVSAGYRKLDGVQVNTGEWLFVAAVVGTDSDYTLGNVKFYIGDGQTGQLYSPGGNNPDRLIDTVGTQLDPGWGAEWIKLGEAGNVQTDVWNGQLDAFRVYDVALDADQLHQVMMIPDPATLSILGLGGLFVMCRKRSS